ncbi:MAG: hypothetical protein BGO67_01195 [Alphaproteobacteria bacterium 41-28]|nr:MAG: hypothetical protein BGO67_01195 [Alphaproteobacteria bacterium 41-28]
MNSFSQFISNTLKVSLLCGISLTAAEKTMAGKVWDKAIDDVKDIDSTNMGKLRRLCSAQKLAKTKEKKKENWHKRLVNVQKVENNLAEYSNLTNTKQFLFGKLMPALVADTTPTVQGRTPTPPSVQGRAPATPSRQGKTPASPSVQGGTSTPVPSRNPHIHVDESGRNGLPYSRPAVPPSPSRPFRLGGMPVGQDEARVGAIAPHIDGKIQFGPRATPSKPGTRTAPSPRFNNRNDAASNETHSHTPKTNVIEQIGLLEAEIRLLGTSPEDKRNYNIYKEQLDTLKRAQALGIPEYDDFYVLRNAVNPSVDQNDVTVTTTTTTTISAPSREGVSASPMISVDKEIADLTRYIQGPDFRPEETPLIDQLAKVTLARERGITAYRDVRHLDTLLAAVSNHPAGGTTTTTTVARRAQASTLEEDMPLISVAEQIKSIEALQKRKIPLDRDMLVLLDQLKQAEELNITDYRDPEDLDAQMVAIGLSEDNFPEKPSTNRVAPAPVVGSNNSEAQHRIDDLEEQLAVLISAGVREAELKLLRDEIKKLKGEK